MDKQKRTPSAENKKSADNNQWTNTGLDKVYGTDSRNGNHEEAAAKEKEEKSCK